MDAIKCRSCGCATSTEVDGATFTGPESMGDAMAWVAEQIGKSGGPTPEDEAANAELRYALQLERSDAAIAKADRLIADLAEDDPLLLRLAESITRGKP